MGNMDSAHPLVEVNVSYKFEGNPSISKGVIERTRIGDGPTDRRTDRPTDATKRIQYSPPHILWWGYNQYPPLYSPHRCTAGRLFPARCRREAGSHSRGTTGSIPRPARPCGSRVRGSGTSPGRTPRSLPRTCTGHIGRRLA